MRGEHIILQEGLTQKNTALLGICENYTDAEIEAMITSAAARFNRIIVYPTTRLDAYNQYPAEWFKIMGYNPEAFVLPEKERSPSPTKKNQVRRNSQEDLLVKAKTPLEEHTKQEVLAKVAAETVKKTAKLSTIIERVNKATQKANAKKSKVLQHTPEIQLLSWEQVIQHDSYEKYYNAALALTQGVPPIEQSRTSDTNLKKFLKTIKPIINLEDIDEDMSHDAIYATVSLRTAYFHNAFVKSVKDAVDRKKGQGQHLLFIKKIDESLDKTFNTNIRKDVHYKDLIIAMIETTTLTSDNYDAFKNLFEVLSESADKLPKLYKIVMSNDDVSTKNKQILSNQRDLVTEAQRLKETSIAVDLAQTTVGYDIERVKAILKVLLPNIANIVSDDDKAAKAKKDLTNLSAMIEEIKKTVYEQSKEQFWENNSRAYQLEEMAHLATLLDPANPFLPENIRDAAAYFLNTHDLNLPGKVDPMYLIGKAMSGASFKQAFLVDKETAEQYYKEHKGNRSELVADLSNSELSSSPADQNHVQHANTDMLVALFTLVLQQQQRHESQQSLIQALLQEAAKVNPALIPALSDPNTMKLLQMTASNFAVNPRASAQQGEPAGILHSTSAAIPIKNTSPGSSPVVTLGSSQDTSKIDRNSSAPQLTSLYQLGNYYYPASSSSSSTAATGSRRALSPVTSTKDANLPPPICKSPSSASEELTKSPHLTAVGSGLPGLGFKNSNNNS